MYPAMFGFQDPSGILRSVKEESLLRAHWAPTVIDTSPARYVNYFLTYYVYHHFCKYKFFIFVEKIEFKNFLIHVVVFVFLICQNYTNLQFSTKTCHIFQKHVTCFGIIS